MLDGAVLVLSAVEGVQPQTRLLMRALQRLRIPTLLFVNKIDRAGAGYDRVLDEISERLTPAIVPMGAVDGIGARAASFTAWDADDTSFRTILVEALAELDDALLAAFVEDEGIPYERLREELAAQTGRAQIHPVFFGSASTGAGVEALMAGITELLPSTAGEPDGPTSGTVFKIERGPAGEKVAYVRMFSGAVHIRDRVHLGREADEKVTAIEVFDRGDAARVRPSPPGRSESCGGSRACRSATRSALRERLRSSITSLHRRWRRSSSRARPTIAPDFGSRSDSSPSRTP